MLVYERINAVVSVTLIGLTLYFVLEFPAQVASIELFGSPLKLASPRQWLMVLLLGGMAIAGADAVVRIHPQLPSRRLSYRATFWMLPGLLVILATQTLGLAPTPTSWAGGLVVVGLLLWFSLYAEFRQAGLDDRTRLWLRLGRQFIAYAVTLTFFIIIYQTRSRSALSATSVMLISGMATLALLSREPTVLAKSWLFAALIGLSLGQMTWALNYWRTGALNAGLLLFLAFYVLVGLVQQELAGTLSRQTLWEFGAITGVALLVIFNL